MSNLIFQRRDLAAALEVITDRISRDTARDLAKRLDFHDRVAATWETVILAQACRETDFAHEIPLPTKRRPDLAFDLKVGTGTFRVIGDVGSVSDAGREDQNPALAFLKRFAERRRKAGLDDMALDTRIGHTRAPHRDGGRATLLLPKSDVVDRTLKRTIIPTLRDWKTKGRYPSQTFSQDGLEVTITRKPDGTSSSAGWAGFVATSDPEDTALFKALKAKRDQLAGAPEDALRLIVIGDGGHRLLTNDLARGPFDVTADDICTHFLRKHAAVDAVVIFAVRSEPPRFLEPGGFRYSLKAKFYALLEREKRQPVTPDRIEALQLCLGRWEQALPIPHRSPSSIRMNDKTERNDTLKGGYEVTENEVKVPARRAVEMLAGIRTPEEWRDEFGGDRSLPTQAILNHIMSGRRIVASRIEPIDGHPGEWLILTFGEIDPSVAPFTAALSDERKL